MKLDKLEKLSKAATPGPWFHYGDGVLRGAHTNLEEEKRNVELIAAMRNNIDALIKVAECADNFLKRYTEVFSGFHFTYEDGTSVVGKLEKALAELERG